MARKISPNYQVGDTLEVEVTPANFGRIAAQNAKAGSLYSVFDEAERGMIYSEFSEREN